MEPHIQRLFDARDSADRDAAYNALVELFAMTEKPVPWAYDVWERLVLDLRDKDGAKRSFSAQMLTRLAVSDPKGRIFADFPAIAAVMRDEKFVTARHTLESLWRVGLAGPDRAALVVAALEERFQECSAEKNASLVRTDVLTCLARLANAVGDDGLEAPAEALMALEPDEKARTKQRAAWRKARGS